MMVTMLISQQTEGCLAVCDPGRGNQLRPEASGFPEINFYRSPYLLLRKGNILSKHGQGLHATDIIVCILIHVRFLILPF